MKTNPLIRLKYALIAISCVGMATASCTKEEVKPVLQDGKSTVINDMPGDVGNTVGSGKPFNPVYFSLVTGSNVDSSKRKSADWDIAFAKEYNSYLSVNSGGNQASFGYGGPGKGMLMMVKQNYNSVKTAPSDDEFVKAQINSAGWDSGSSSGWYFYDLNTHIAVPIKNRTYIIKTADGKFAKLELVSMYKGAPSVVTDLNWPAPYFTFRYYVQQDGSRNLSTNDQ